MLVDLVVGFGFKFPFFTLLGLMMADEDQNASHIEAGPVPRLGKPGLDGDFPSAVQVATIFACSSGPAKGFAKDHGA